MSAVYNRSPMSPTLGIELLEKNLCLFSFIHSTAFGDHPKMSCLILLSASHRKSACCKETCWIDEGVVLLWFSKAEQASSAAQKSKNQSLLVPTLCPFISLDIYEKHNSQIREYSNLITQYTCNILQYRNIWTFEMCITSASLCSAEQLEKLASVADRKIA